MIKIGILCLLLMGNVGCAKKTDTSTGQDDRSALRLNKNGDQTSLEFPPGTSTCQAFYAFIDTLNKNYISEIKFDPIQALQDSVKSFSKDFLVKKFGVSVDDVHFQSIKKNDCSVFESLALKIKDQPKFLERYQTKDKPFDALELIFNGVLLNYVDYFDAVSTFGGIYTTSPSKTDPATHWGIRFLSRPDYYTFHKDKETVIEKRNPPYLYVEYSPDYLRKKLPNYSRIYNIGTKAVKDFSFEDSLKRLSEESDTTLTVRIWNSSTRTYGDLETLDIHFEQTNVPRETSFKILSTKPNIGYIQIPSFNDPDIESDYLSSWIEYMQEISGKSDGVIIDLRNNGGGSYFLTQKLLGTIFPSRTVIGQRIHRENGKYTQHIDKVEAGANIDYGKIVVLMNSKSASASEIFASTIQQYGAGLLVGETSIGKGIGQQKYIIDADHLHGHAYISNFYFYDVSGGNWYLKGIRPDISIPEPTLKQYNFSFAEIKDQLPPPYVEGIESSKTNDIEIKHKLTPETLNKLTAFRTDSKNEPESCKKSISEMNEEDSCMLSWGYKILQEWIKIEGPSS